MHTRPTVLYVGTDAAAVERAWRESDATAADDGFTLRGVDPTTADGVETTAAADADDGDGGGGDAEPVGGDGGGGDAEPVGGDGGVVEIADGLASRTVDAVVCHSDGEFDAPGVVECVRDYSADMPVVVLESGDAFDAGTAADLDVTTYLQLAVDPDPKTDVVARVERLADGIARRVTARRERTMLTSLLEEVPLSIYFKDRQGRHVRVSDEMPSLTDPGYLESPDGKRHHTPEDVVGKTDFDLYPADLAEETTADDRRVVEDGESIDDRVERAYGDELTGTYVTTSKAQWRDEEGRVVGLVGVTRNITERMQYEKQLERQNERLERFASVISHDLRNPLEVAMGRLEFARTDGDEEHFEALERALRRMDALIDDVLTLAREGETVSDPEPTDLDAVAADAWTVVDTEATTAAVGDDEPDGTDDGGGTGATLRIRTEASLLADPSRLQQLLENVFRNAVEHSSTSPGSQARQDADVTVTIGDLDDRDGFFVADDGPGIPESDREDVFEPGYSTGDAGTGLGLSIVRSIAEAHGWDVSVAESDDGGARFEFETLRV